jgi:hypothetical protein
LKAQGYTYFGCDDLIARFLEPELVRPDGTKISMGEWMGFPYQSGYRSCEAKYLAYEAKVLTDVLDYLESYSAPSEEIIVDTTGSVIYTGSALLKRLSRLTTVVYLETPPTVQERLCRAYIANPPPVLWRDHYQQRPDETPSQALGRCYPALLAARTATYKEIAQVTLDYFTLRQEGFNANDFIEEIKQQVTMQECRLER